MVRVTEKGKADMFRWRSSWAATGPRNLVLWTRLTILRNLPVIYTPTVGEACLQYKTISASTRNVLQCRRRGSFNAMMYNWKNDVSVIVVTDGSRFGSWGPRWDGHKRRQTGPLRRRCWHRAEFCASCVLDVVTDSEELLADPYYFGQLSKTY